LEFPRKVILRGGAKALILDRVYTGSKPLIGAYFTGEDWIPLSWTDQGRYDKEGSLDYNQDIVGWDVDEPN
jgi:hypothetical protein